MVRLTDFMSEEAIHLDLASTSKDEFFRDSLLLLREKGLIEDPDAVLTELRSREEIMSTGIGQGVAIPHAQSEAVSRVLLSVWRTGGIDFAAMDGKPVNLILMILGPRDLGNEHVKILAKISRLLHGSGFRDDLLSATSGTEVMAAFRRAEEV